MHALHNSIGILNVVTEMIPYVAEEDRLEVRQIAPQVWRNHIHYGFMQQPDLPTLLELRTRRGLPSNSSKVTYFIGRETVVRRTDGKGLPWPVVVVFSLMYAIRARRSTTSTYRGMRSSRLDGNLRFNPSETPSSRAALRMRTS